MREAVGIFDSLRRAEHLISSDLLMDQPEIFNLHREQAEHINNRRQADPEPINNTRIVAQVELIHSPRLHLVERVEPINNIQVAAQEEPINNLRRHQVARLVESIHSLRHQAAQEERTNNRLLADLEHISNLRPRLHRVA